MTAIIEELDPDHRAVELPPPPSSRRTSRRGARRAGNGPTKRTAGDWVVLLVAIVLGFFIAVPFLLILVNSFKSPADYNTSGPLTLPTEFYFDGIVAFWERVDFPQKLWNSVFISGLVAVFAVALSMFNAFALGIGRVKGRLWIVVLILLANMLPQEVLLYPLYFMFKQVGLYDSQWAVIIIFTVLRFGLDQLALSGFRQRPMRLLLRLDNWRRTMISARAGSGSCCAAWAALYVASRVRERLPVQQRAVHIGVARQRPEVVALVVIDGRVLAEALVHRVGIGVDTHVVRIEVHARPVDDGHALVLP